MFNKLVGKIVNETNKFGDTLEDAAGAVTNEVVKGTQTVKNAAEAIGHEVDKGAHTTADVLSGNRSIRSVAEDIPNEVMKAASTTVKVKNAIDHEVGKAEDTLDKAKDALLNELRKGGFQEFLADAGADIMREVGKELCAAIDSLKDAVGDARAQVKAKILELLAKSAGKILEMATRVYEEMKPVIELVTQLLKSLEQHSGNNIKFVNALAAFISQKSITPGTVGELMKTLVSQCGDSKIMTRIVEEFKMSMAKAGTAITNGTLGFGGGFGGAFGVDVAFGAACCIGLDEFVTFITKPDLEHYDELMQGSMIADASFGFAEGAELNGGLCVLLNKKAPDDMDGPGLDFSVSAAYYAGALPWLLGLNLTLTPTPKPYPYPNPPPMWKASNSPPISASHWTSPTSSTSQVARSRSSLGRVVQPASAPRTRFPPPSKALRRRWSKSFSPYIRGVGGAIEAH